MEYACPSCDTKLRPLPAREDITTTCNRKCKDCGWEWSFIIIPRKPVRNGTSFAYRVEIYNWQGTFNMGLRYVPRSIPAPLEKVDRRPMAAQAVLVMDLLNVKEKWDMDKAMVLADWCEERSLHGAAENLRKGPALTTVQTLKRLMGIKILRS